MPIPVDALDEFIQIYKEVVGEELSRAKALEIAMRLLTLYGGIVRHEQHAASVPAAPDPRTVSP